MGRSMTPNPLDLPAASPRAPRETRAKPSRRARRGAQLRRQIGQWHLDDGITVVLFAGLGGACEGLNDAGIPVAVANNHDEVALAAHAAMHPHTKHIRGDIFDVDPIVATGGQRVLNLWASPDCRDHSVAKGGAPRSPRVRSLPWQVCRWMGKTAPLVVYIENVREIRGWGPLIAKRCLKTGRVIKIDGTVAAKGERVPVREQQLVRDPQRIGRSYRAWVRHMRGLGYAYDSRDLCCADYGVPTTRRRFFAVARRDGVPIAFPARTHAPAHEAAALGLLPWVPAWTIIDWSLVIPSIFDRAKPLVHATERRIAAGLRRYVLESAAPFLIPITHSGAPRVHGLDEPLRTLTTAHRGEIALVAPSLTVFNQNCVGSDMDSPVPTATAGTARVGIVAASLTKFRAGSAGASLDEPLPTVTANGHGKRQGCGIPLGVVAAWMAQHNTGIVGHEMGEPLSTLTTKGGPQQVAAAFLAKLRGTSTANDIAAPVPTLSAGGTHIAAVAAFMVKYYGAAEAGQRADEPLHALTVKARFGVVTVTIGGESYAVSDIGMRMLQPHEMAAAHELRLPDLITVNGMTRPLTKTEATRLIGNSVPKRMAQLLAEANAVHALRAPQRERAA
jgi:DNA (cytosine-5)-methyltransferase 1